MLERFFAMGRGFDLWEIYSWRQRSANVCAVKSIVGFLYKSGLAVVEQKVSLAN